MRTATEQRRTRHVVPRALHPAAWWLWALGLGLAASRTSNPLVLALILAVVGLVVAARRTEAPWARGFRTYFLLGLLIVAIRVIFRMLFGSQGGQHVLFELPEIPLPDAAAGIRLGGAVSAEGLLASIYDGLRLATLVICVGAANVLADPKRLLKRLPGAVHSLGTAITVTLSVAPQLVESAQRIRRARRLRGSTGKGRDLLRQVAMPVMVDALDRSLLLAAAMDTRGYGRTSAVDAGARRVAGAAVVAGAVGVCIGSYGLLDASVPRAFGVPALAGGLAMAVAGMLLGGRHVQRSHYRPDPWRRAEWLVTASGLSAGVAVTVLHAVDPTLIEPSLQPLRWPTLPPAAAAAVLLAALPAWLSPPPALSEGPS